MIPKVLHMLRGEVILSMHPFFTRFHTEEHRRQLKAIAVAGLYGTCSFSTTFLNKALMTLMGFNFPVVIMICQMIFTVIALHVLSLANVIVLPAYARQRAIAFFWPAFCYAINAILALNALSHMNIAMYGVLKRCVPLSTLLMSVWVLNKGLPSRQTIISILLLTTGCVIAGYGDLGFDVVGYFCGALSNITHALYLLLVQWCNREKQMSTLECLQLNSIITLPILIVVVMLTGEVTAAALFNGYGNTMFYVVFIIVLLMGCLLNYSLFLCTNTTSALTTSVVGGVKALAQTFLGFFTFGGVSLNVATFLGISMNLTGSIMYIYTKLVDGKTSLSDDKHISSSVDLRECDIKSDSVLETDHADQYNTQYLEVLGERVNGHIVHIHCDSKTPDSEQV